MDRGFFIEYLLPIVILAVTMGVQVVLLKFFERLAARNLDQLFGFLFSPVYVLESYLFFRVWRGVQSDPLTFHLFGPAWVYKLCSGMLAVGCFSISTLRFSNV